MGSWRRDSIILSFARFSISFPIHIQETKDQLEGFLENPATSSQAIKICCTGRKCLFLLYLCVILNRKLIFLRKGGSSSFKKNHTSFSKWLLTESKLPWIAERAPGRSQRLSSPHTRTNVIITFTFEDFPNRLSQEFRKECEQPGWHL